MYLLWKIITKNAGTQYVIIENNGQDPLDAQKAVLEYAKNQCWKVLVIGYETNTCEDITLQS